MKGETIIHQLPYMDSLLVVSSRVKLDNIYNLYTLYYNKNSIKILLPITGEIIKLLQKDTVSVVN